MHLCALQMFWREHRVIVVSDSDGSEEPLEESDPHGWRPFRRDLVDVPSQTASEIDSLDFEMSVGY